MNNTTRRRFLAMAGAGAAAAGAATVLPAAAASSTADHPEVPAGAAAGPYVAYVEHLHSGEVSVMVGDAEVTVVDRDLAARIARLSQQGA